MPMLPGMSLLLLCAPKLPIASDRVALPFRVRDHRQRSSGQKAIAAGYQMKKSVVLPLITTEMHPGEAIEFALDVIHPFTQGAAIDSDSSSRSARACRPSKGSVRSS